MDPQQRLIAILDIVDFNIALLDHAGFIRYVNRAWVSHGIENGLAPDYDWIGCNYLEVCVTAAAAGDPDGQAVLSGLRSVMDGRGIRFTHDYACHSPNRRRWFTVNVAPGADVGNPDYFVVWHQQKTDIKLAVEQVREENERLARLASTDELTNLSNRRQLDADLLMALERAETLGTPLSLIMCDIDHFKSVNDTYGHTKGDEVLRDFGGLVRSKVRGSDNVGRWGGEEFLVLLAGCELATAGQIAEKIRSAVAEHSFSISDKVTASFGVTDYKPGHDAASLIACVDAALYAAKYSGRDRVVVTAGGCGLCLKHRGKLPPGGGARAGSICGCHA